MVKWWACHWEQTCMYYDGQVVDAWMMMMLLHVGVVVG
jgi:hypothetical protein